MAVLLLDTHSLFFRAFHALPPMSTAAGLPTQALYGLSALLLKLLREEQPEAVAFARDLPHKTFRHLRFPGYKAGRAPLPDSLRSQLGMVDVLCAAFGFPVLSCAGFEADDVLATLAEQLPDELVVVSGDRDLLQLVNARTTVLFAGQRGKDMLRYDLARVEERFGFAPARLPLYSALVGDGADNLPKVPGIGEVGARRLVARFESAEALLGALPSLADARTRTALAQHADQIRETELLARLRRDVPLPAFAPAPFDDAARARVRALFEVWEFRSLLTRLDARATGA